MKAELYICDDYALDKSTDLAIEILASKGKIDGASILATHLRDHDLKKLKCKFGLHLNLTEGKALCPLSIKSKLTDKHGKFKGLSGLFFGLITGSIKKEVIEKEIIAQIDFLKKRNIMIHYLDGHQHIQFLPWIKPLILSSLEATDLKSIRIREGMFLYPTLNLKYFILNCMSKISKPMTAQLYGLVDYNNAESHKISKKKYSKTEFILHVAHPKIPIQSLDQTSYNFNDRVKQFQRRLRA